MSAAVPPCPVVPLRSCLGWAVANDRICRIIGVGVWLLGGVGRFKGQLSAVERLYCLVLSLVQSRAMYR